MVWADAWESMAFRGQGVEKECQGDEMSGYTLAMEILMKSRCFKI